MSFASIRVYATVGDILGIFQSNGHQFFPFGKIVEIPLEELYAFKNHPFRVLDDEQMEKTVESIKDFGVLIPGLDVRGLKVDMRLFLVTGENALQKLLERKLCQ